jgi:superfamily II DNA/RNA helicase
MTLMLFQNGQLPVIVCNNLASRGLDTSNVQHVIQFEFAKTTVDYMQRVGRVGRMGQKGGVVTNFIRGSIDSEIEKIVKKQLTSDNNWDKVLSYKTIRKRKN